MRFVLVILTALVVMAGCAAPVAYQGGYDYGTAYQKEAAREAEPEVLKFSLFKSDQEVISDEVLDRILSSEVRLPSKARIGVFRLKGRHTSFYPYSEAFMRMQQGYLDSLSASLTAAERVRKVTILPSLVTPKDISVPVLREAAARLQADMLLVFQVRSDIYSEYKIIGKDRARAHSTCEALLLDVRTGLIPFASIVTSEAESTQHEEDMNSREMLQRAEEGAVLKALEEVARQIKDFIDSAPVMSATKAAEAVSAPYVN